MAAVARVLEDLDARQVLVEALAVPAQEIPVPDDSGFSPMDSTTRAAGQSQFETHGPMTLAAIRGVLQERAVVSESRLVEC